MKAYPLFIPPGHMAEKTPELWSKEEAKQYYKWLLQAISERTSFLMDCFGENASTPAELLLKQMGEKMDSASRSNEFVEDNPDAALTNAGFALAADMGLLVARLLLSDPDVKAKWFLVTSKCHVDYNLPVIKGVSRLTFNPVRVSTVGFVVALRNKLRVDPEHWLRSYLYWKSVFSK